MRRMLLASATLFGMSLAAPAFALNTTTNQPPGTMPAPASSQPAGEGTAMHHWRHASASNIVPTDTHSRFAHKLPATGLGPNAAPTDYLQVAQDALRHRRGGAAQEALERAETRLLDRSVPMGQGGVPDQAPAIQAITQALDALGRHDWVAAQEHVGAALHHAQMAANESGTVAPAAGAVTVVPASATTLTRPMANPPATGAPMTAHNVTSPSGGATSPVPSY